MGLFSSSFKFLAGMGCGVYVAQNYNVPNVKKLFNTYVSWQSTLRKHTVSQRKMSDYHTSGENKYTPDMTETLSWVKQSWS